jgi:hypothetical protein
VWNGSRRDFLRVGTAAAATGLCFPAGRLIVRAASETEANHAPSVTVLNPRERVPLSFVIDDSTCLVNMGHFCMPQFATAFPTRDSYQKPWKTWPREIPDAFVREFGEWCAEHDVKGKYSIVPYPACVGWLDRELPGWSRRELLDSLKLVRELMVPNWDIHPEMITHTRVIDLKTGRPFDEISEATMENSYPQTKKSVDELASYLAFALRILQNCDLPCEGITTPGGFGNLVKSELSLAVHQAVRDVYATELPHYFKYIHSSGESTEPILEHVRGLDTDDPQITVNVPAGTGDWFGGWDGSIEPAGDRYCNRDASAGRMVEMIERGEPAVMLCHWPGMYTQGTKRGFAAFQQVVLSLDERFHETTLWMKLSEIGRYWTAKQLTKIVRKEASVEFKAPFAAPAFTVRVDGTPSAVPQFATATGRIKLQEVHKPTDLKTATWRRDANGVVACFDLPKGLSELILARPS